MRARLLAAALLAGCAGARPPAEPTSPRHGLLMSRARVRGAVIPFTSDEADRAKLEQIGPDGEPVPGATAASGFSRDGAVYFLDLPPGRYALTAVSFRARGARYEVALSSAVMRKETVELAPGEAAFLGALSLDGVFPDFDVAVERALDLAVRWPTPFLRRPPIPRDAELRGVDRGPAAERAALHAARGHLSGTQWLLAVERRLRETGAPEPEAESGVLRRRALPLRPEDILSWRDTLGWGEPARSAQGLSWRDPEGGARVAVFYTSAATPGFAGYEEAVRQMRAAAGGLQDPAAVYEVRVGTRTGTGGRATAYVYPQGTLVGSEVQSFVTETVLVPDGRGMYTARLRAPRAEFPRVQPAFREFLRQLSLGPPAAKPVQEP